MVRAMYCRDRQGGRRGGTAWWCGRHPGGLVCLEACGGALGIGRQCGKSMVVCRAVVWRRCGGRRQVGKEGVAV